MPSEEELRLDISEALRAIDQIGDRLSDALGGPFPEIEEAVQDALGDVRIDEIDATAVTEGIDEAIADADATVTPDADAEPVGVAIEEAVQGADATVVADADVEGITDDIEQAVASADATVEITADTSGLDAATEQVAGLRDAAGGAAGGVGELSGAMDGAGAAAGVLSGGVGGAVAKIGGMAGPIGAVAGAALAFGGATKVLFDAAIEAEGAWQSFTLQVGDFADEVQAVRVGDLDRDLGDLAVTLGSDDEAALSAAAAIFTLGKNSGAAAPQAAQVSREVAAMGAFVRATRPELGDMGTVMLGLEGALTRGGRAAQRFGLDISAEEIKARAAQLAHKDVNEELSRFELLAGGTAVAIDKYGDKLDERITEGSKNAVIQQQAIGVELANVKEELGAPLVSPMLDIMRSSIPMVRALGQIVSSVARVALPILAVGAEVAADKLEQVDRVARGLIAIGQPVANAINAWAGPLLKAAGAADLLNEAILTLATGGIPGLGPLNTMFTIMDTLVGKSGETKTSVADDWKDISEAINTEMASANAGINSGITASENYVAAVDAIAQATVANLPGIGDLWNEATRAADEAEEAMSPERFIRRLEEQVQAVTNWKVNVERLVAAGYANLAATALQLGPQVGGALAQSMLDATPETRDRANGLVSEVETAYQGLGSYVEGEFAPKFLAQNRKAAEQGVTGFGTGIGGLPAIVPITMEAAAAAVEASEERMYQAAHGVGVEVPTGVEDGAAGAAAAAAKAANDAILALQAEEERMYLAAYGVGQQIGYGMTAGSDAVLRPGSPSKAFIERGREVAAGMALGVAQGSGAVLAAVSSMTAQMLAQAQGPSVSLSVGQIVVGDPGSTPAAQARAAENARNVESALYRFAFAAARGGRV